MNDPSSIEQPGQQPISSRNNAVLLGLQLLNQVEELNGDEREARPCSYGRMQSSPNMYPTEPIPPLETRKPPVVSSSELTGATAIRVRNFPLPDPSESELAELASPEISLDLQGLIDDTHFGEDNLFGDLIQTAKKNDGDLYGMSRQMSGNGLSSGSSGQPSPGSEGQNSPPNYGQYSRNTLTYIPGGVHNGHMPQFPQMGHPPPHHHAQMASQAQASAIQVKQEPLEQDFSQSCSQTPSSTTNPSYIPNGFSNGAVSSSTQSINDQISPGHSPLLPFQMGGALPSLKSFANPPKYLSKKKSGGDKSTEDYRRRRERNNVAVRKSREKAKARTKDTEDRVKILARENERLQKKVELLQEELSVLRSLFSSVGVLPDHIHRELAKHLDNFQAQHTAMNY